MFVKFFLSALLKVLFLRFAISPACFHFFSPEILGLGAAPKFHYLDREDQMMVMDIHLFLADQVRFEMMRRLGCFDNFTCERYRLLEMVQDFNKVKARCKDNHPELVESYPEYCTYKKRFFSNLVGEESPRIPGVKDSSICCLKILSAL